MRLHRHSFCQHKRTQIFEVVSCTPVSQYLFVNMLQSWNIWTFSSCQIILLAFFKNTNHLGSLNLLGCFVLSQSTNFFVHEKLNNFLPRIFLYFVREEIFAWKKNRNFEELTSANFYWKFAEWTVAFTG